MGVRRFDALLSLLPSNTTVLGIDEQTACIFDFETNIVSVMGNGAVTIIHSSTEKMYRSGETFMFNTLF
jgi:cyanophycinase-like exopeptidase